MTNNHSITFYFSGLQGREKSIVERVIAFNVKQGLSAKVASAAEDATLLIVAESELKSVESFIDSKTIIAISDSEETAAHFTFQRPLLITKVMNTLAEAVEHSNREQDTVTVDSVAEEKSVENEIENSVTTLTSSSEESSDNTDNVETESQNSEEESTSLHALVIDDSAAIRKQLELELRDAGITSDFAESGEQALDKIKEAQFDLVFLDIIMPGIDGYETCKAMRATAEYKKTPIIMLSGKTSPLDEVQGVIAGATTYLTKPVKSDKLQETLTRVSKWINNFATAKDSAAV